MNRATFLCTFLLMLLGGRLYVESRLQIDATRRTPPARPLAEFPRGLLGEGWTEVDRPLRPEMLEVANVTDYLQRDLSDGEKQLWFYVGYVDHWDPSAVHHPRVCFPRAGFELQRSGTVEFPFQEGSTWNELVWKDDFGRETYTLYAFYYHGHFEANDRRLRADRILGIPFFAIVTLSGPALESDEVSRDIYSDILERLLPGLRGHFPDGAPNLETPPDKSSDDSSHR